jgi:hypothetical protein
MRAKLIDGELITPPYTHTTSDGCTVVGYPQREDLLIADGWKTVEDVTQPSTGLWVGSWLESAEAITQVWKPREKTDAEAAFDAYVAERDAKVAGLRTAYRQATRALCREAGITEVDVLTADQMDAQLFPLLEDVETSAKLKRNGKLQAYTTKLLFLTMLLRAEDGKDALDRI